MMDTTFTAFRQHKRLGTGSMADIQSTLAALDGDASGIVCMNDKTGQVVDVAQGQIAPDAVSGLPRGRPKPLAKPKAQKRSVGRPSLGVVAREVTLLPKQWAWLASQPESASAVLRRLVSNAMQGGKPSEQNREAMAIADNAMRVLGGDLPGYEEATRALYRADSAAFDIALSGWPKDVRVYVMKLAQPAFAG